MRPAPSGGNRMDSITEAPFKEGALGCTGGYDPAMEKELVSKNWKGHLGRGLAPREILYLLYTAEGLTAKEIARVVGVAPCTVSKRLSCAMFKLKVTRQTAMVAEAIKLQIITPI